MAEFLQSYGLWIFLGLVFSMMIWGSVRGRGGMGGCGMGGHQHDQEKNSTDNTNNKEGKQQPDEHRSGCH